MPAHGARSYIFFEKKVVFMCWFLQKLPKIKIEKQNKTYLGSTYNLLSSYLGSTYKCSKYTCYK